MAIEIKTESETVSTMQVMVDDEVVGSVNLGFGYGDNKYHAGITLRHPTIHHFDTCLIQGFGATPEAAVADAIRCGREISERNIQLVRDFEMQFEHVEMSTILTEKEPADPNFPRKPG